MQANFYTIRALTNLHAGSGDSSYGVVDNLVQRDAITELPVIHGSSLKGALKEYFKNSWINDGMDKINYIFGADEKSGHYYFLEAQLLAIPVRSKQRAYFMATAPMVINSLISAMKDSGAAIPPVLSLFAGFEKDIKKRIPVVFCDTNNLIIEGFEKYSKSNTQLGNQDLPFFGVKPDSLVLLHDEDFKGLCDESNLPVIARNQLENGMSKNLWYEQVVPRETRFWTTIFSPGKDGDHYEKFKNGLVNTEKPIHIGANATVGYGFTKFIEMV